MKGSLVPVILAGGKGERFWPLSRKHRPKQFLSLDGSGKSLLQATADRLLPLAEGWDNLWVVTSQQLASGVQAQLPDLPAQNVLAEPEGRDTAPAVAWSTLEIAKRYGEQTIVGFFPADPWIDNQASFQATLSAATLLASAENAIVTLGVKPSYASTGYGYIEQGELVGSFGGLPVYRVNRFTEKPDRQTAEEFLVTNRFSWNSGMFIFKAQVVLDELRTHTPEMMQQLEDFGVAAYSQLPKISIDYALMEKTQLAYVLPVDFGWDDLGDWNAIERLLKKDAVNVELAHHVGLDTKDSLLYATSDEDVIVTIGLEDVVIVRDRNVTLIVKQALKLLQNDPKFTDLL